MIVIARFSELGKAHVARASLEAAGIYCFIADEHTTNLGFYTQAIGGARLLVNEEDAEKALEILRQDFSKDVDKQFSLPEQAQHCPHCKNDKLTPDEQGNIPVFICVLLLGLPFLLYRRGYRCNNCGVFTSSAKIAEINTPTDE